jgi:hypothetical protein
MIDAPPIDYFRAAFLPTSLISSVLEVNLNYFPKITLNPIGRVDTNED